MRKKYFVGLVFFLIFTGLVVAEEIVEGTSPGSVVLHTKRGSVVYENITGNRYGVDRSLVPINGRPGLLVLSRDNLYFTLSVKGRGDSC
ncbi:hypothetical protein [Pseudomonas sp. 18175]|uniref:hypothetical protein n=1 Tax=Pseudomonas sp. 18175 TaxID=3390056 RepID=UPI003D224CF5